MKSASHTLHLSFLRKGSGDDPKFRAGSSRLDTTGVVKMYATLQEITDVFREVFGMHQEPVIV